MFGNMPEIQVEISITTEQLLDLALRYKDNLQLER